MEYVCNIKCGGGERREEKRTTFLDVPPNRFGCRGDDNERTNERERTSTPPPPTLCATGKGGGRSGATEPGAVEALLAVRSSLGQRLGIGEPLTEQPIVFRASEHGSILVEGPGSVATEF